MANSRQKVDFIWIFQRDFPTFAVLSQTKGSGVLFE
jgi:hypothetical protein